MASTSIDIGHEISPHLTGNQFTYKHLSLFIHTYKQEQQHLAVASSGTSLGTETACTRQLWLLSVCNYVAKNQIWNGIEVQSSHATKVQW